MEAKRNYFEKITGRSQPSAEGRVDLTSTTPRKQVTEDHHEFDTMGPIEDQRDEKSPYADTAIRSMPIKQPRTEEFVSKMNGEKELMAPPVLVLPAKGIVGTFRVGEISEGKEVEAPVNRIKEAKSNDKSIDVDLTKTIAKAIVVTGSNITASGFDDQSPDVDEKVAPELKIKEHYNDRYLAGKKTEGPGKGAVEKALANKRVLQLNETIAPAVPTASGITSFSHHTKSEPRFSIGKITVEVVQPQTPVTIVKHQVHHSNGVQSRQEFSSINKLSFGLSQL